MTRPLRIVGWDAWPFDDVPTPVGDAQFVQGVRLYDASSDVGTYLDPLLGDPRDVILQNLGSHGFGRSSLYTPNGEKFWPPFIESVVEAVIRARPRSVWVDHARWSPGHAAEQRHGFHRDRVESMILEPLRDALPDVPVSHFAIREPRNAELEWTVLAWRDSIEFGKLLHQALSLSSDRPPLAWLRAVGHANGPGDLETAGSLRSKIQMLQEAGTPAALLWWDHRIAQSRSAWQATSDAISAGAGAPIEIADVARRDPTAFERLIQVQAQMARGEATFDDLLEAMRAFQD